MKTAAKFLGPIALAATIIPPILFAFKAMGEGPMKVTLVFAAIAWFAAAPFWLKGGEA